MASVKKHIYWGAIALFVLLIAAYSNHFHNGFHFDDSHAIVDNVHIRSLSNIPQFFTDRKMFSNDPQHWGLRPLVTTTLAIDYHLAGGLNPFWFQLDTFAWFVLLCIMLYFVYVRLLRDAVDVNRAVYIGLGATALYALHTANAETINYIISRTDVLSTFCIVASFLIYINWPDKRKWFLYAVPAALGVFAKETVLVLVILLFFYILIFEDGLSIGDIFRKRNFKIVLRSIGKVLPLLIIVAAIQAYTLSKTGAIAGITNPPGYYILTQSWVWLHYFITFFLPLNLSADSDWTVIRNVFDERIILGVLFVICLVIAITKTSQHQTTKPIAFGLIWFAAALLPTSIAPFAEVTNDHRMFFPFIGLALSAVTAIAQVIKKHRQQAYQYRILISCGFSLVLALNAYGVYQRNKVWHTEESLWLDVTVKSPQNGRGLMNYGLTQMQKGNYAVADIYFQRALTLLPYYSTLYINIGVLKGATKQLLEAELNFKKAISLSPDTFEPYVFYARFLKENNRLPEARVMTQKALGINPYSQMALRLLTDK